jgi:hypothetical protein
MHKENLGKIILSNAIIENEDLVEVFYKMKLIPYRVEHLWHESAFEYGGYSPLFDELKEGEVIPEYQIEINTENGLTVTVKRKD